MTSPTSHIIYHARDNLDYIVTFSIQGRIYDYQLTNISAVSTCDYLARRWTGKGLAYARRHGRLVPRKEPANATD